MTVAEDSPTMADLRALLARHAALVGSPPFKALVWQYIADVSNRDYVLPGEEEAPTLALVLAHMYINQLTEAIAEAEDVDTDVAKARAGQRIEEQRVMYGSLAAEAADDGSGQG